MDGKIPIAEYVQILKSKGFQGMLVTDHDSYNGFRRYRDHLKGKLDGFVVLKGIEYDTIDAGHILVILPEHVKLLLMECRGLPVRVLQEVVQTRRDSPDMLILRRAPFEHHAHARLQEKPC